MKSTRDLLLAAIYNIDIRQAKITGENRNIISKREQLDKDKKCYRELMDNKYGQMYAPVSCIESRAVVQYYANISGKEIMLGGNFIAPNNIDDELDIDGDTYIKHPWLEEEKNIITLEKNINKKISEISPERRAVEWTLTHLDTDIQYEPGCRFYMEYLKKYDLEIKSKPINEWGGRFSVPRFKTEERQ